MTRRRVTTESGATRTGLDRLALDDAEVVAQVRGKRLGLLAHAASVDRRLVHAEQVIRAAGGTVVARFGPEHGFSGSAQDMVPVPDGGDAEPMIDTEPMFDRSEQDRRVQTYSLYGETAAQLSPRREWLEGLDAVVIDLQDVGSRYYTYVWTAAYMLRAAASVGVPVVVLDRPNPLGGEIVEGAPQRPGYRSFVGAYEVSVRHGLTIGELLEWVRRRERLDVDALAVVPMIGWRRSMHFEHTGLPWVMPSPNMPTVDTAWVYPGACVLEGTQLSEGRGTTRPFEIWGAPGIDGAKIAAAVSVEGATLRPIEFEPAFQKHARTRCGGVQVHVTDRDTFRAHDTYLRLIVAAQNQLPGRSFWRRERYEYETSRLAIDLLTGGPEFRFSVTTPDRLQRVLERERRGASLFADDRRAVLRHEYAT